MKQLIICLAVAICGVQLGAAQVDGPPDRARANERMEAQLIGFITQKLELTSEEAAQFWPIFNEFRKAEEEKRESIKPEASFVDMTEAQAEKFLTDQLRVEGEVVELRKKYIEELKAVISAKKIVMLSNIEREFKRRVLEHIRDRRGNREGPPGRND